MIDIKIFYEKYIEDIYYGIKNYFRNLIRYSRILWSDKDWDYDFFLNIQETKLKYMENYHNKSEICVENPWIASRLRLARNLLSVARSEDSDKHEELYWTPYVNIRNAKRFNSHLNYLLESSEENSEKKQMALYDLRLRKAWYLYHKCLFLYTQSWWD